MSLGRFRQIFRVGIASFFRHKAGAGRYIPLPGSGVEPEKGIRGGRRRNDFGPTGGETP